MPDDEQLERELGDRIRSYAASADRPIDPVTVATRAMGPQRPPSGGWVDRFRVVLAAAAGIAVVVVTLGIGVLIASGSLGGRTAVGGSPSPSAVASAPVASSDAPTASPTPSETAAPTPSSAPPAPSSAAPTATPSTAPPATPTPSPSATPSPSGDPVAASFSPRSVTFVSPNDGIVLGAVPCPSGSCAALARTSDAGRTWTAMPAPVTTIAMPSPDGAPAEAGVATVRFADANNGWVFGPELWSTHDGGRTWTRVDPTTIGGAVLALETARGTTHAVIDADQGRFAIVTSPVGKDDFKATGVQLEVGAGPVPAIQLVLSGDAGWVLQNDRTVVNGARLRDGTWSTWTPVCADVVGPAYLAASSPSDLVAACDVGLWGDPKGGHLFASTDGGTTWKEVGSTIPVALAGAIASGSVGSVAVSGSTQSGNVLEATFDNGRTWSPVADLGTADAVDLGFTTADQGVVVALDQSGSARFLMTRDGGRSWSEVAFR